MMRPLHRHSVRSTTVESCCACSKRNSSSSIRSNGNNTAGCSNSNATVESDQLGEKRQRQDYTDILRFPPFFIRKPISPCSRVWSLFVTNPILFAVLCAGVGWKFTSLSTICVSSAANTSEKTTTFSVANVSSHHPLRSSNEGAWLISKAAGISSPEPEVLIPVGARFTAANPGERRKPMLMTKTHEASSAFEPFVPLLLTSKRSLRKIYEGQQQQHLSHSGDYQQRVQRRRGRVPRRNEYNNEDLDFFDDNTFSVVEDDVETRARKAIMNAHETLLSAREISTAVDESPTISQQHSRQQHQQPGAGYQDILISHEFPNTSPISKKVDANVNILLRNSFSNTAAATPEPRLRPFVEETTTAPVRKEREENNVQRNRAGKIHLLKPVRTKVAVKLLTLTAMKMFRIFLTVKLWSWFIDAFSSSSAFSAIVYQLGSLYLAKTVVTLASDFISHAKLTWWYLQQIQSRNRNLSIAEARQEERQQTPGSPPTRAGAPQLIVGSLYTDADAYSGGQFREKGADFFYASR